MQQLGRFPARHLCFRKKLVIYEQRWRTSYSISSEEQRVKQLADGSRHNSYDTLEKEK